MLILFFVIIFLEKNYQLSSAKIYGPSPSKNKILLDNLYCTKFFNIPDLKKYRTTT